MKHKGILFLLGGLLVGVLLGVLVVLSGPRQSGAGDSRLPPTVGSPVSDFELPSLEGGSVRLSELKNKPVVVNFWASWCGPCKEEMPLLDRVAKKYPSEMVLLGINYAETEDVVKKFVTDEQVTFPILLDKNGLVDDLFYVRNYPTTFFIDADGVLRAQHFGVLTEDALAKYLALIGIE